MSKFSHTHTLIRKGDPRAPKDQVESQDVYSVTWTHADGPVQDTHLPAIGWDPKLKAAGKYAWLHEVQPAGTRATIEDEVSVPAGSEEPDVIREIEKKRKRLAANLGVEP